MRTVLKGFGVVSCVGLLATLLLDASRARRKASRV